MQRLRDELADASATQSKRIKDVSYADPQPSMPGAEACPGVLLLPVRLHTHCRGGGGGLVSHRTFWPHVCVRVDRSNYPPPCCVDRAALIRFVMIIRELVLPYKLLGVCSAAGRRCRLTYAAKRAILAPIEHSDEAFMTVLRSVFYLLCRCI